MYIATAVHTQTTARVAKNKRNDPKTLYNQTPTNPHYTRTLPPPSHRNTVHILNPPETRPQTSPNKPVTREASTFRGTLHPSHSHQTTRHQPTVFPPIRWTVRLPYDLRLSLSLLRKQQHQISRRSAYNYPPLSKFFVNTLCLGDLETKAV